MTKPEVRREKGKQEDFGRERRGKTRMIVQLEADLPTMKRTLQLMGKVQQKDSVTYLTDPVPDGVGI